MDFPQGGYGKVFLAGSAATPVAEPEEAEGESSAGSLYAWGVQYDGSASASAQWPTAAHSWAPNVSRQLLLLQSFQLS